MALIRWDRAVSLDQLLHHAAGCLDAERQRRHVQEEHALHALCAGPRHDRRLHGGAERDRLVGVDVLAELLAVEVCLDHLLHSRDPRGATHHDDLVNL
mmetsp:Transcript_109904/g.309986  ORF Transcript_109904/g.309986 Transcript_109904/m.309986 type:complete len:98 (+) Transcript_109904:806-1099(+)